MSPRDSVPSGVPTRVAAAGLSHSGAPPTLGYLLRTFPILSETFVAREIRAVAELTGQPAVVAALYRPGPGQAGVWERGPGEDLLYWRDIDKRRIPGLALAWAKAISRRPLAALGALSRFAPGLGLADRVKAAGLAGFFDDHGVTHLHSHFCWEQADMLECLRRLSGLPYSLTLHAADIFIDSRYLQRRLAHAAFVATISEYNKQLLLQRLQLPSAKVHVVHCGVALAPFAPPAPLEAGSTRHLFSLGRMVPKKGFDILLAAIAKLRDAGIAVTAELAGDGPMRPQLLRLAGELGLGDAVRFPGALQPAQVADGMRRAHAVVLACRQAPDGDMDGIPVVLMEAMALGRLVVSTRLSGIPELVAEGCGLLAQPGDADSLAQTLAAALTDASLTASMVPAARRRVERHFTLEGQARRILALAAAAKEAVPS